jgi:ribulose-phosphate 3-epimerase
MGNRVKIAPSFLSADFLHLAEQVQMMNSSQADYFHMDVMDGVFVPNISFGFPVIKQIKSISKKPLDVHLMIVQPERYIERFAQVGADILTVHYEAVTHLHRVVQSIKQEGMKAGVAINPHTPVENLLDILPFIDLVLVMSVNPGFGGQKFIKHSLDKIKRLRSMIDWNGYNVMIEVDGGVSLDNAEALAEAGVDILVAGSAIFGSSDPVHTVEQMKILANSIEI